MPSFMSTHKYTLSLSLFLTLSFSLFGFWLQQIVRIDTSYSFSAELADSKEDRGPISCIAIQPQGIYNDSDVAQIYNLKMIRNLPLVREIELIALVGRDCSVCK